MDYEHKYKNALEWARGIYPNAVGADKEGLEHFFPELKESEDEMIRKELIKHLKEGAEGYIPAGDNDDYQRWLAWLEKQGETDKASYEIAEKEKREFVGDGFIKCYGDFQDFKDGETYWLEYVGNDNYNVRSDNLLGKTYHITPCQLYTFFKKLTLLEKQGEHKLEIYNRALEKYGFSAQRLMLVEECAELLNAISKQFRNRATKEDIITELADVHIMVEQMALFFGWDDFVDEKMRKLKRLDERLKGLEK